MSAIQATQPTSPLGSVHVTIVRILDGPRQRKHFATIRIDDTTKRTRDDKGKLGWDESFSFDIRDLSSTLTIEVHKRRTFREATLLGRFEDSFEALLRESFMGNIKRPLAWERPLKESEPTPYIEFSLQLDLKMTQETYAMAAIVHRAKIQVSRLQSSQAGVRNALLCDIQSADDVSLENITATWDPLLEKLEIFSKLARTVSEVRPYAAAAYNMLTVAYKLVVAQVQRDINILYIVDVMDDIYTFVIEAEPLRKIESHQTVMTRIAQQTTECGSFISAYCRESFVVRAMKYATGPTDTAIVEYGMKFTELKVALLDHATINTEIIVLRALDVVDRIEIKADLRDLPYARGAQFHGGKQCLPGTRQALLTRIKAWVDNPDTDRKCIFLLCGDGGAGKSTVAHSIAQYYHGLGRLGSSIFVALGEQGAETRIPARFFPTIARDLADFDIHYRHRLWVAMNVDSSLRHTTDPADQFKHFILALSSDLSLAGPIVLIIDGLESCDDVDSLFDFSMTLAAKAHELPSNFRIILTASANSPTLNYFVDSSNVDVQYLDGDGVLSTHSDLLLYAEMRLGSLPERFRDVECLELVRRAHGSFQWLSSTCDKICARTLESHPSSSLERYRTLILGCPPGYFPEIPTPPNNELYYPELHRLFDTNDDSVMARFKSVVGCLAAARCPLSVYEVLHLQDRDFSTDEEIVGMISQMGSFLSPVHHRYTPLVPFYPFFFDFVRDSSSSREFYVNVSAHHYSIASACIRVLNNQLRFNICRLYSSYLRNSEVVDLQDRVEIYISPELLYASRFWVDHLCATDEIISESLAVAIQDLLQIRIFFWIEVLSILGCVNVAVDGLANLVQLCQTTNKQMNQVSSIAAQAFSFLQLFELAITLSTPHLYVSALRFCPTELQVPTSLRLRFPLFTRHLTEPFQSFNDHKSSVTSVAFSADSRAIISTSEDGEFCSLDLSSGELEHHAAEIKGGRVSGSRSRGIFSVDCGTVTVASGTYFWRRDVKSGELLNKGILLHNFSYLFSWNIALHPDGRHIALSGSRRHMLCVSMYDTEADDNAENRRKSFNVFVDGLEHLMTCLEFSPRGSFLAFGTHLGMMVLWDTMTGENIFKIMKEGGDSVHSLVFTSDEKCLVSVHAESIQVRDARTGSLLRTFEGGDLPSFTKSCLIDIDPSGQYIIYGESQLSSGDFAVRSASRPIRFMDLKTGELDPIPPLVEHAGNVTCLTFSPDGTMVVSGSGDNTVRVWRVAMPFGKYSLYGKGEESGWILGPKKELLAWAPPDLREGLDWTPHMFGEAHGTSWTQYLVE